MILNPLALFASLLGRLLNRIAPQPKPRAIPTEKAVILPFSRKGPRAPIRAESHYRRGAR